MWRVAMVFNVTFNNISAISQRWRKILLRVSIQPAASHRQILSYNVVSPTTPSRSGSTWTSMMTTLYKTNMLSWISIVLAHWNKSTERHVSHIGHIFSDSKPTSLLSYSLTIRDNRRSNEYQCYSLWFDPTGGSIHDLSHSLQAR